MRLAVLLQYFVLQIAEVRVETVRPETGDRSGQVLWIPVLEDFKGSSNKPY